MWEQILKALGVKPEDIRAAMLLAKKGQEDIETIKTVLVDILEIDKDILRALRELKND